MAPSFFCSCYLAGSDLHEIAHHGFEREHDATNAARITNFTRLWPNARG